MQSEACPVNVFIRRPPRPVQPPRERAAFHEASRRDVQNGCRRRLPVHRVAVDQIRPLLSGGTGYGTNAHVHRARRDSIGEGRLAMSQRGKALIAEGIPNRAAAATEGPPGRGDRLGDLLLSTGQPTGSWHLIPHESSLLHCRVRIDRANRRTSATGKGARAQALRSPRTYAISLVAPNECAIRRRAPAREGDSPREIHRIEGASRRADDGASGESPYERRTVGPGWREMDTFTQAGSPLSRAAWSAGPRSAAAATFAP